jgi:hypothetical protein
LSDLQQWDKYTATLAGFCSSSFSSIDGGACMQLLKSKMPQLLSLAITHSLQLVAAAGASAAASAQVPEPAALDVLCKLTGCIKECLQAASNTKQQQPDVNTAAEALECSGEQLSMHAWHMPCIA